MEQTTDTETHVYETLRGRGTKQESETKTAIEQTSITDQTLEA